VPELQTLMSEIHRVLQLLRIDEACAVVCGARFIDPPESGLPER
jgi:hypothetical protein